MNLPAPFQNMKSLKTLVLRAEQRAKELGDPALGAEHLLLAALEAPDGSAARVFARVSADPDAVLGAIDEAHDAALRAVGVEPLRAGLRSSRKRGPVRLSESAAHVLRSAAGRSRHERPRLLGAQIVAGVAELEHGTAPRALRVLGIDRGELAVAADAELRAAGS